MPPCPAGSHIKPALEWTQWVLPEALCLAADGLTGWNAWLAFACSLEAPTMVRINELCTSGPPAYPEIDPVKLAEQGQLYAWSKNLSDFVWAAWVNANWAILCECLPVTGPGPCPPVAPWGGTVTGTMFSAPVSLGERPIGHDWTTMTGILHNPGTNTQIIQGTMRLKDASHAFLRDLTANATVGSNVGCTWNTANTLPSDRANVRFLEFLATTSAGSPPPPQATTFEITGYTGSCTQDTTVTPPPPAPSTPPPPPTDPPPPPPPTTGCTTDELCDMLYKVLQQLRDTGQLVTLLQRYGLPFKYVYGPVHASLSGASSFAISNLVGVQTDITSALPPKQLEGTPPYVWDLGWMSIMTGDGMIEERRITRDTQVWQPRLMQEAITFGYFLKPGVVARVTELQPEPF